MEPIIELIENQQDVVSTPTTATTSTIVKPASPKKPREPIELDACMKIFAGKTILENDSAFFCSKCDSKQRADKSVTLNQLPPILMLTL